MTPILLSILLQVNAAPELSGTETQIVDQIVDHQSYFTWAAGGAVEARLWDGTRVDILTKTHAIEADWSSKWAEAIGQCMYYSIESKRKPGIVLLVKDRKSEAKYIYRCKIVAAKLGIDVWLAHVKD